VNPLTLVPLPYRLIGLALLSLALWGFGWVKGAQHGEARLDAYKATQDAAVLAQQLKAGQITANWRADALVLEEVKNAQLKTIDQRLADALADGMRHRAERRPDLPGASAAASACAGGTGAGLSRPDAGFLDGEAARANRIRAALEQCYAQYEQVRQRMATLATEATLPMQEP
jgi:hypothetical protein